MKLNDILTLALTLLIFIFGVWQYFKNKKLQEKNLELQKQLRKDQQEKDADEALEQVNEIVAKENLIRSDAATYCDHIYQKFKHLDFTGLNSILQKPLLLEEVYVKLKAKKSFALAQYHNPR
jgi:predicted solute-binding protein